MCTILESSLHGAAILHATYSSYSFGPGGISTAIKALIGANVALFLVQFVAPAVTDVLGLRPIFVVRYFWVWQLATYMFLHGGVFHIVFNMLALWMFGTELERRWGTPFFLKFYAVTGIGAGVLTVLFSLLPFAAAQTAVSGEHHRRVGRDLRPAARATRCIFRNARSTCSSSSRFRRAYSSPSSARSRSSRRWATRAASQAPRTSAGCAVAYVYLKSGRMHPIAEIKYRYLKWKINRVRKKFDVYSGGRANDYDRRVH